MISTDSNVMNRKRPYRN